MEPQNHALRSLGRTGVVDGMVFDVLRQVFATVQTFFQLGVCDVTAYDDGSIQRQTGGNRILGQFLQNIGHRLVQVNLHHVAFTGLYGVLSGISSPGLLSRLFNPDTFFIDFTLDVTVGRAGNTQTHGTGRTVTRQADDAYVVSQIFTAELGTEANLELLPVPAFQFHIAESAAELIAGSG